MAANRRHNFETHNLSAGTSNFNNGNGLLDFPVSVEQLIRDYEPPDFLRNAFQNAQEVAALQQAYLQLAPYLFSLPMFSPFGAIPFFSVHNNTSAVPSLYALMPYPAPAPTTTAAAAPMHQYSFAHQNQSRHHLHQSPLNYHSTSGAGYHPYASTNVSPLFQPLRIPTAVPGSDFLVSGNLDPLHRDLSIRPSPRFRPRSYLRHAAHSLSQTKAIQHWIERRSVRVQYESRETEECAICLDAYEKAEVLRLLQCGHRFHVTCVDTWLIELKQRGVRVTCPICRREMPS